MSHRHFSRQTGVASDKHGQFQINLWRTHRLQGRPDDKDKEQQDEAEPPLAAHLVSTGHST